LGLAVARALVQEGCNVAACGRDAERCTAAATQLATLAPARTVLALPCDVTDAAALAQFMAAAEERLGGIDILVTNTGGPPTGTFDRIDDTQWQQAFESMLLSAVRAMRAVLPGMQARGFGRIVAVSSISAKQPLPNLLLSNALRAGLTGCLKTLARAIRRCPVTFEHRAASARYRER
jgi:3-oxoacyl-[acyl-carrier protein] reductase